MVSSKGDKEKPSHRENTIFVANIWYSFQSNMTTGVTSSLGWPHAQLINELIVWSVGLAYCLGRYFPHW